MGAVSLGNTKSDKFKNIDAVVAKKNNQNMKVKLEVALGRSDVNGSLTPPALISFLLNSLVGLLNVSFSQRRWLTGGLPSKFRKRS